VALSLVLVPSSATAQQQYLTKIEAALRAQFEGKAVTLRIDMPGTSEGVNVVMEKPFDAREYGSRIRNFGVAIHTGERVQVTQVKVKRDIIEFQLAGGGFGTFGDDTSTSANIPLVEKSNREKDLEKLVRDEKDTNKRNTYQRELDDLRRYRERENRRIEAERTIIENEKRREIARRRLESGSRFNIRFPNNVPEGLGPEAVMTALAEYVDFSSLGPPDARPFPGSFENQPQKGMLRADAERRYGRAVDVSQRREGTLTVITLVFLSGDQRITAEFVEDVLIRFVIGRR
jgi:hypothetical protein